MLLSLILPLAVMSQPLDQKLDIYIEDFQMTALTAPAPKRVALYDLGHRLFRDVDLSGKGNINCAMCHMPPMGTSDGMPLSLGEGFIGGGTNRRQESAEILLRNSPPLYNLGFADINHLFWDGRVSIDENGNWLTPEPAINGDSPEYQEIAHTLDSLLSVQALFPIADPAEMLGRGSLLNRKAAWENAVQRILKGRNAELYQKLFFEAFGAADYNIAHIANALAEFQRHHFYKANTPWDQYLKGDKLAMSEEMKKGALVFMEKAKCANCHNGAHLSAYDFDSVGTPHLGLAGRDDLGRMQFTGLEEDRYMFRVPPLRNIALTAPYMHNGVFKTMWEVIDFYTEPEKFLWNFQWANSYSNYVEVLTLDTDPIRQQQRIDAMAEDLPRKIDLTSEERSQLWCYLMGGLTDISLRGQLADLNRENSHCLK